MFENSLFLGNTLYTYFVALVILLCSLAILHAFKFIFITKAKRFAKHTKTDIDDLLVDMFDTFNWFYFIVLSVFLSLKWLALDFGLEKIMNYMMFLLTLFFGIKALLKVVDYVARKLNKRNDGESNAIVHFLATLVKGILWLFAILFILSNLGVNITSAMAGLGIGGIAIALALQNILGDLFSSVSIYFDKPFKIDDFIIVGEHMGVVKNIGIKTTRIESL